MLSIFGLIDHTLYKWPHNPFLAVFHKPTHLDRCLNFRSEHPI